MKILIIRANDVNPDPRVEKEVTTLTKFHKVHILAWDRSENYNSRLTDFNGIKNATITRFGLKATWGGGMKKNLIPFLKFQLKIIIWMFKNRSEFNVIHAIDLPTVIPSIIIKRVFKKKIVYDIFDYYASLRKSPKFIEASLGYIENKCINLVDAVIICSESRREQIKGTSPKLLEVIHNSPSARNINNMLNVESVIQSNTDNFKVVYVGNLINDRFINEILELAERRKEIEFHIGGIGVLSDKVKIYSKKNSNIYFYGKLSYEKVLKLETECDIMLALYNPDIPNHKYAAPNKFYEALVVGAPLIMFKNTGMDQVVKQNGIGEVIDFNIQSLSVGIDTLIRKKDEWGIMKKKMRILFQNNYSWEMMEYRLLKIYNDV